MFFKMSWKKSGVYIHHGAYPSTLTWRVHHVDSTDVALSGGESSPCIFFQYVYLKYTNAVASLFISLCRIQLFWYRIFSVFVLFFYHLLWGCFIRLLENDWCCQKPCINQLIVDKIVECVLMSVGSLGPADSKVIFLNIRKRRSKICNFYDTCKRGSKFYVFHNVFKKVGSTYTTEHTHQP